MTDVSRWRSGDFVPRYTGDSGNGIYEDTGYGNRNGNSSSSDDSGNYKHLLQFQLNTFGQLTHHTDSYTSTTVTPQGNKPGAIAKEGAFFVSSERFRGALNNILLMDDFGFGNDPPSERFSPLGGVVAENAAALGGTTLNFAKSGWVTLGPTHKKGFIEGDIAYGVIYPPSEFKHFKGEYDPEYLKSPEIFIPPLTVSGRMLSSISALDWYHKRIQINSAKINFNAGDTFSRKKYSEIGPQTHVSDIHMSCSSEDINSFKGQYAQTSFLRRQYIAKIIARYNYFLKSKGVRDDQMMKCGMSYDANGNLGYEKHSDSGFEHLVKDDVVQAAELSYFAALNKCKCATIFPVGRIMHGAEAGHNTTIQILPSIPGI